VHFNRSSLVCLLACASVACPFLPARADDWPQWRGPGRDGVWREAGVMQTFPEGGPKVAWRARVGRGYSSPAVVGGRVYLTDVEVERPRAFERVLCLDAASGKVLWTHRYDAAYPDWALGPDGGGPRATPLVHDGKVYTLGATGNLFCLDAKSGGVVWQRELAKDYDVKEFSGITASPLIERELLILFTFVKPGASVIALDRRTGKEVWRALDDTFSYSSPIVFTDGGKRQLIVWTQEAVTSLDPATGHTWWRERVQTPGDMAVSTPVYANHRLLVSGLMFKLDPDRPAASVLWPASKALGKRVLSNTSTAQVQGDCIFSSLISGELVCMETETGKELWRTDKVTSAGNGSSIHIVANGDHGGVLLYTDGGDLIRARLHARGYHEISRAHLLDGTYAFNGHKRAWAVPAFADRHVFVRNDEELVCADLSAPQKP
jgi:outer membrane protein assembly factor BamB